MRVLRVKIFPQFKKGEVVPINVSDGSLVLRDPILNYYAEMSKLKAATESRLSTTCESDNRRFVAAIR